MKIRVERIDCREELVLSSNQYDTISHIIIIIITIIYERYETYVNKERCIQLKP